MKIEKTNKTKIRDLYFYGAMIVTPELAKEFLTKNIANRKINKKRVLAYASDISKNEWCAMSDGLSITFDRNGNLLNGQHRLHAIIESNTPLEMFIFVKDFDGTAEMIITDTGLNRSLALITKMSSNYIATVCCVIRNITNKYATVSVPMFKNFEDKLAPNELEFITLVGNYAKKGFHAGIKTGVVMCYLLGYKDDAESFWEGISNPSTDINLQKIRERIISGQEVSGGGCNQRKAVMKYFGLARGISSQKIITERFEKETRDLFASLSTRFGLNK